MEKTRETTDLKHSHCSPSSTIGCQRKSKEKEPSEDGRGESTLCATWRKAFGQKGTTRPVGKWDFQTTSNKFAAIPTRPLVWLTVIIQQQKI